MGSKYESQCHTVDRGEAGVDDISDDISGKSQEEELMARVETGIKTIAVGIDGSRSAINALRWARDLAGRTGAAIAAVSAWDYPALAENPDVVPLLPPSRVFVEQTDAQIEKAIDASSIDGPGPVDRSEVAITPVTVKSASREALVQVAVTSDLLVVGRKGMTRLTRLLVGSTTAWVTRHAPGAVTVVPDSYAAKGGGADGDGLRILVGYDGSEASAKALQWAALNLPGMTTAIFVFDPRPVGDFGLDHEKLDHIRDRQLARIDTKIRELGPIEASIDRLFVDGSPADALVDNGADYDLIVVGAGSRDGFPRLLLGSVADYAVQHASVPIVVVR